jgi:plastocyanin
MAELKRSVARNARFVNGVFMRRTLLASFLGLCLVAKGEATKTIPGTIEGTVKYEGEVPKSQSADDAGTYRDLLEVDSKTGGLLHVVAYLELPGLPGQTNGPGDLGIGTAAALINQQDHAFTPRLLAVRAGQTVTFTNSDPANHNVRASSRDRENQFNVFTGVDGSYQHRFVSDPKHRPVPLTCDIHPWMQAWLFVFDHPHFALTDRHGKFRIPAAPPGEYRLVVEQPDLRYRSERNVIVKAGEKTLVELSITSQ